MKTHRRLRLWLPARIPLLHRRLRWGGRGPRTRCRATESRRVFALPPHTLARSVAVFIASLRFTTPMFKPMPTLLLSLPRRCPRGLLRLRLQGASRRSDSYWIKPDIYYYYYWYDRNSGQMHLGVSEVFILLGFLRFGVLLLDPSKTWHPSVFWLSINEDYSPQLVCTYRFANFELQAQLFFGETWCLSKCFTATFI